tara:strand:+ start:31268 stop:31471 length:204 start_codon:yes stop_codon:yes gene_type:complete
MGTAPTAIMPINIGTSLQAISPRDADQIAKAAIKKTVTTAKMNMAISGTFEGTRGRSNLIIRGFAYE